MTQQNKVAIIPDKQLKVIIQRFLKLSERQATLKAQVDELKNKIREQIEARGTPIGALTAYDGPSGGITIAPTHRREYTLDSVKKAGVLPKERVNQVIIPAVDTELLKAVVKLTVVEYKGKHPEDERDNKALEDEMLDKLAARVDTSFQIKPVYTRKGE